MSLKFGSFDFPRDGGASHPCSVSRPGFWIVPSFGQLHLRNTTFDPMAMAPSRGLSILRARRMLMPKDCVAAKLPTLRRGYLVASAYRPGAAIHNSGLQHALRSFRISSPKHDSASLADRGFSSFTEQLADPANRLQSYISSSSDPYLNLSIEDHILRESPTDSTVLFLYVNRPCVVIGRNQNPWTEVNLSLLNPARGTKNLEKPTPTGIGRVDLVRRRSGGGTVFHDGGNLNWSITCPRGDFTRDKHAEMVVRALRKLGIDRARVNERHDIVLDQGQRQQPSDPSDTHRTPYTTVDDALPRPLKVSGSAYKLTRQRALHHATTLLSSPNLPIIPQYLRSPAKKLIQAKGVESVSSPVGNIGLDVKPFQQHLQEEFAAMYAHFGRPNVVKVVGDDYLVLPEIRKGYDELLVCLRNCTR